MHPLPAVLILKQRHGWARGSYSAFLFTVIFGFRTSFLGGKWMVCTIPLPLPGRMTHQPCRSARPPPLHGGSADTQSVLLGNAAEAVGCKRQNTNEGAFLPSDGSVPNPAEPAGCGHPRAPRAGGLALTRSRAGCSAGRCPRLSADSPWGQPVNSGGGRVSPNKQVSCSGLKTMAAFGKRLLFVKGWFAPLVWEELD